MRHLIALLLMLPLLADAQIYIDSYRFGCTLPLLDCYPGAAGAYSLRLLDNDYTGNCIRVVKNNGDSSLIGFSGGILDTNSLKTFCGTGATDSCTVRTWFDQSGNGRHFRNDTIERQPVIMVDGAIIRNGGEPALRFRGTTVVSGRQGLYFGDLVYTTNTLFAVAVASTNSSGNAFAPIFSQNSGAGAVGRSSVLQVDDGTPRKSLYFFNNGTSYNNTSAGTLTNDAQSLITNYSFSDDYFSAINGSSGNSTVSGQSFTPASTLGSAIGNTAGRSNAFRGTIQEIIIWNFDQSGNKSAIETSINTFYSIY